MKLFHLAKRIILDKMPNSEQRQTAIREAALKLAIYEVLFEKFDTQIVPDHASETYLTLERDFTEDAARKVIAGYVDTYSCAGFDESAPEKDPTSNSEIEDEGQTDYCGAKINDLIQWENNGALQFSTLQ